MQVDLYAAGKTARQCGAFMDAKSNTWAVDYVRSSTCCCFAPYSPRFRPRFSSVLLTAFPQSYPLSPSRVCAVTFCRLQAEFWDLTVGAPKAVLGNPTLASAVPCAACASPAPFSPLPLTVAFALLWPVSAFWLPRPRARLQLTAARAQRCRPLRHPAPTNPHINPLPRTPATTATCKACFCYDKGVLAFINDKLDLNSFCLSFWGNFIASWALKGVSILCVLCVNFAFVVTIKRLVKFERHHSETARQTRCAGNQNRTEYAVKH